MIKSTSDPYLDHLLFVANKAGPLTCYGYEIGLCHDLLEKTAATAPVLQDALLSSGYADACYIVNCVVELTRKADPALGKKDRKTQETARLQGISPAAQTVKYADLLYNIGWVARFEKRKAKKIAYLKRKRRLLLHLDKGAPSLLAEALTMIDDHLKRQ